MHRKKWGMCGIGTKKSRVEDNVTFWWHENQQEWISEDNGIAVSPPNALHRTWIVKGTFLSKEEELSYGNEMQAFVIAAFIAKHK